MATLRQKTAFGPGKYRDIPFDSAKLAAYVEGTNKAIAAGVPIPLLKEKHAPLGANDEVTAKEAERQGAGWIKSVFIGDDGALGWEAENVPDDVVQSVNEGTVRFTSPEFRENYTAEKADVYSGPIIRHFAVTPLPGNPHQGVIETVALSEATALLEYSIPNGQFQFAEEEREPLEGEAFSEMDIEHQQATQRFQGVHKDHAHLLYKKGWRITRGNKWGHEKFGEHDFEDAVGLANKKSQHAEEDNDWEIDDVPDADELGESQHAEGKRGTFVGNSHQFKTGQKIYVHHSSSDGRMSWISEHKAEGSPGSYAHHSDYKVGKWRRKKAKQYAEEEENNPLLNPPDGNNPPKNPDMPPVPQDRQKTQAILAGLAQKGLVLPSDFDFSSESAPDILLAAINSSLKAEQDAESKKEEVEPESPPREAAMPFEELLQLAEKPQHLGDGVYYHGHGLDKNGNHSVWLSKGSGKKRKVQTNGNLPLFHKHRQVNDHTTKELVSHFMSQHEEADDVVQFSEEELNAMPAKARLAIEAGIKALADEKVKREEAERNAVAFAEKERIAKVNAARDTAVRRINDAKLPPVLREALIGRYTTVQFNEGVEAPSFTAVEVADMFKKAIPPSLQFEATDAKETEKPETPNYFDKGDLTPKGHVTPERAKEIVDANPLLKGGVNPTWVPPTIEKFVKEDNARFPSKVMNT